MIRQSVIKHTSAYNREILLDYLDNVLKFFFCAEAGQIILFTHLTVSIKGGVGMLV